MHAPDCVTWQGTWLAPERYRLLQEGLCLGKIPLAIQVAHCQILSHLRIGLILFPGFFQLAGYFGVSACIKRRKRLSLQSSAGTYWMFLPAAR
jgi:hypothetical protein